MQQDNTPIPDIRELTGDDLRQFVLLLLEANPAALPDALGRVHYSDIADLLEQLPLDIRKKVVEHIPTEMFADVLAEVNEGVQETLLADMDTEAVVAAVREMDSDDAADIVQHLEDAVAEEVQEALSDTEQELLIWPENSAGGLMQLEVLALPQSWTVGETLKYLRGEEDEEIPDNVLRLYVIEDDRTFLGSISLHRLVRQPLKVPLGEMMNREALTITPETPAEEVAYLFEKYDLHTCPVVDEKKRLLGQVTVDDILDVVLAKRERDFKRAAGLDASEDLFAPVLQTTRQRFPWLLINLFTAVAASLVIALFEEQIAQLVALAVLMPIVASMGGNAGTQTLTVTVRGLAMKQITPANAFSLLWKEVQVGSFNGLLLALLVGAGVALIYGHILLGTVIFVATVVNHVLAALAGHFIPLLIKRYNGDPAIASGVLVTTVTDVGGFFVFLGLASLFLL